MTGVVAFQYLLHKIKKIVNVDYVVTCRQSSQSTQRNEQPAQQPDPTETYSETVRKFIIFTDDIHCCI